MIIIASLFPKTNVFSCYLQEYIVFWLQTAEAFLSYVWLSGRDKWGRNSKKIFWIGLVDFNHVCSRAIDVNVELHPVTVFVRAVLSGMWCYTLSFHNMMLYSVIAKKENTATVIDFSRKVSVLCIKLMICSCIVANSVSCVSAAIALSEFEIWKLRLSNLQRPLIPSHWSSWDFIISLPSSTFLLQEAVATKRMRSLHLAIRSAGNQNMYMSQIWWDFQSAWWFLCPPANQAKPSRLYNLCMLALWSPWWWLLSNTIVVSQLAVLSRSQFVFIPWCLCLKLWTTRLPRESVRLDLLPDYSNASFSSAHLIGKKDQQCVKRMLSFTACLVLGLGFFLVTS